MDGGRSMGPRYGDRELDNRRVVKKSHRKRGYKSADGLMAAISPSESKDVEMS